MRFLSSNWFWSGLCAWKTTTTTITTKIESSRHRAFKIWTKNIKMLLLLLKDFFFFHALVVQVWGGELYTILYWSCSLIAASVADWTDLPLVSLRLHLFCLLFSLPLCYFIRISVFFLSLSLSFHSFLIHCILPFLTRYCERKVICHVAI